MSLTHRLLLLFAFALITYFFLRQHKKAIKEGKYVRDRWGWPSTLWSLPLLIFGFLCLYQIYAIYGMFMG